MTVAVDREPTAEELVDLATVVGVPELPDRRLVDDLERDGPPLDWDSALERILTCSPELQVARAEVLRDEITVRRERVQPVPNMFARVETGYNFEVNLVTTASSSAGTSPS